MIESFEGLNVQPRSGRTILAHGKDMQVLDFFKRLKMHLLTTTTRGNLYALACLIPALNPTA